MDAPKPTGLTFPTGKRAVTSGRPHFIPSPRVPSLLTVFLTYLEFGLDLPGFSTGKHLDVAGDLLQKERVPVPTSQTACVSPTLSPPWLSASTCEDCVGGRLMWGAHPACPVHQESGSTSQGEMIWFFPLVPQRGSLTL